MVLRRDGDGVLAVGQASHAWLCGQLARAWGNERFGRVVPLDEVALGAEQHDVGMARWDLDPVRDPVTGLPQSFMEMGAEVNARLWARGPERLVTQSRYAALLAIMHGRRLYERHDLDSAPAAEAGAVGDFLEHARHLERGLLRSLRSDPETAAHATPERLARNSQLVWTWDLISLALLLDWAPLTLDAVPTAHAAVDVALTPTDAPQTLSLEPWPFADETVTVHCEGRRFGNPNAPWETVTFALRQTRCR